MGVRFLCCDSTSYPKAQQDRLGVCGVLHRLPLKSASETFDGDIAARIAGAAFTCDDEDLSSIKQSLDGTARGSALRLAVGCRSSGSPPARATNHCRSPAILQVGDDPLSKTSFHKAVCPLWAEEPSTASKAEVGRLFKGPTSSRRAAACLQLRDHPEPTSSLPEQPKTGPSPQVPPHWCNTKCARIVTMSPTDIHAELANSEMRNAEATSQ